MSDTVLDLSKLVSDTEEQGDPIVIDEDGQPHFFRDRDAMTLRERAQLDDWIKRHDKLAVKERPTEADEVTHKKLQVDICAFVLPTCAPDVFEGLEPGQRTTIIVAFLVDSGTASSLGKALISRSEKIGALASPGSNGSTG